MIGEAQTVVAPAPPTSLFDRFWPAGALAAAATLNLVWMCFVGYGVFKLLELAFS
jgi:hypothetical protein